MAGLLVNDYSQRNPPTLGEAMTGLLGNWGGNIEQGLLSALPVLAENDPYKIGQQLLREGAGVGGIAWHASPHKWVQPDLSKMGTGEGAQAYGHGFYSAESDRVTDKYFDAFTKRSKAYRGLKDQVASTPESYATEWFRASGGDTNKAIEKLEYLAAYGNDLAKRGAELLKTGGVDTPANIYKLNIPDETIDKMLDWDKPLREQTSSVQSVLDRFKQRDVEGISELTDLPMGIEDFTGKDLYRWTTSAGLEGLLPVLPVEMNRALAPTELASEYLNSLGIPGIKYLDGMSRAAGQGSRNFVSFTPDHIEMLERNGVPIKGLLD
jgi:hypothetical protein